MQIYYTVPIQDKQQSALGKKIDQIFYLGNKKLEVIEINNNELKLYQTLKVSSSKQKIIKIICCFTLILPLICIGYRMHRIHKWSKYHITMVNQSISIPIPYTPTSKTSNAVDLRSLIPPKVLVKTRRLSTISNTKMQSPEPASANSQPTTDSDGSEAYIWIKEAALAGNAEAMFALAIAYEHGRAVEQNDEAAVHWYTCAGTARALVNLGKMYMQGRGALQDEAKAFECFSKAALADHSEAMYDLGSMYEAGQGCAKNESLAQVWYKKAANLGHIQAGKALVKYNIHVEVQSHIKLEPLTNALPTNVQPLSDDQILFQYLQRTAEAGNPSSRFRLAWMYEMGRGVEQNYLEAIRWYTLSNTSRAKTKLGVFYLCGRGVKQNSKLAFSWFLKAAEDDHADAMYHLGWMYEKGYGCVKSLDEAHKWYKRASDYNP